MPKPIAFRSQDYHKLKKECIAEGKLFTDPEFPPSDRSIFAPGEKTESEYQWKRPKDIIDNPHLFVDGASGDDVTQGVLGNCWFVAACSALSHYKSLWQKVIPDANEQEWSTDRPEKYCGLFHFCFYQFEEWVDVVVDDMLPTKNGHLVFAHSRTRNEFWSALLEKAFAKLFGCYEALIGGTLTDALVDITGGIPESIDITADLYSEESERLQLFNTLKHSFNNDSLIAAAIKVEDQKEIEQSVRTGLVKGHAYSITAIKKLELDADSSVLNFFNSAEKIMMLRLRNPWGEKEWNGAWSDGSAEWTQISEKQKHKIDLKIDEDGEFWMSFEDFCKNFTDISVCHMINTSFFSLKTRYHEAIFKSMWSNAVDSEGPISNRAGGCINNKATFLSNPQFRFDISDEEQIVLLCVHQRDVRHRKSVASDNKKDLKTIGLHVIRVENNRVFRIHRLVPRSTAGTSDYFNGRSVFLRLLNLRKGRYVVLPTTFKPGEETEFMITMYSTSNLNAAELDQDSPMPGCCAFLCYKPPMCVTRVTVISAHGLENQDSSGGADPYCIVECEKQKEQSQTVSDTLNPQWNYSVMFMRRQPQKPIKISVYNSNMLKDDSMGQATIDAKITNDDTRLEVSLEDPKTKATKSGKLIVEISTYDDTTYL